MGKWPLFVHTPLESVESKARPNDADHPECLPGTEEARVLLLVQSEEGMS